MRIMGEGVETVRYNGNQIMVIEEGKVGGAVIGEGEQSERGNDRRGGLRNLKF